MIHNLSVSLRGWHPDGRAIPPSRFLELLGTRSLDREVIGQGHPWQAARIILSDLDLATFRGEAEPSEAFAADLAISLLTACHFLASIPSTSVQQCIDIGLRTDCFVEVWMDSNQFDLGFPTEFLAELTRLRLSLNILSNT